MISSISITYAVPVPTPSTVTQPCVEQPRPEPVLDKTPRYKCHLSAYAGPSDRGEHELHLSEDQYVRMLRIAHESRRNP